MIKINSGFHQYATPEESQIVQNSTTAVHVAISFSGLFSLLYFLFLINAIPQTGWDAKK